MDDSQCTLQDLNRETVRRFLKSHGLERASLFTKDGYKVLPWTEGNDAGMGCRPSPERASGGTPGHFKGL